MVLRASGHVPIKQGHLTSCRDQDKLKLAGVVLRALKTQGTLSRFSMFVPKHIGCGFYSCHSHDQFLNSAFEGKCHSPNEKGNQECRFHRPKDHMQERDALGLDVQRREGRRVDVAAKQALRTDAPRAEGEASVSCVFLAMEQRKERKHRSELCK